MHHLTQNGLVAILAVSIVTSAKSRADDKPAVKKDKPAAKAASRKQKLIKISKETTYLTEPLTKDGYVDYLAALNNQQQKGVTHDNNAAVVFRRALGPGEILKETRLDYFKLLGIDHLPEKGAYFAPFGKFMKDRADGKPGPDKINDLYDKLSDAMRTPWKSKDTPELAAWLNASRKQLDAIVVGTRRPRLYTPIISPGEEGEANSGMMVAALLPAVQEYRELARALSARAMLSLGNGNVEQAHNDVMACHRLARLVGQGPSLIDALVSIAIHSISCQADTAIAHHGELTARQALKYRANFDALPPLPKMIDKINVAERYMYLDIVSTMASKGPDTLMELTGSDSPGTRSLITKLAANVFIDWNIVMTMGNDFYDRYSAAARLEDREKRVAALAKIEDSLKKIRVEMTDPASILKSLLLDLSPRKTAGKKMGGILLTLLAPALSATLHAEERGETRSRLNSLTFAIAAYESDNNANPKTLADLSPKYVKQLPTDPRTGKSFVYRRIKAGYILYGVGRNGKDDDGQTFGSKPRGDDIVIRIPK
jgi:hypothetical protein